jgi:ubiquinone/menaquinone biosynthesis C-methylase UbiE
MKRHDEQNSAILDQFTKQAESYARLVQQSGDTSLEPLLNATRPTKADRVLDLACGAGSFTLALARVAGHVTGLDLTPAMIEQARALQAELGIDNVDWRLGDALPLPFPDASFTLVVTRAAFHHLADPGAVLGEMARVCSPAGRIAVLDMTPDPRTADALNRIERLRDPSHVRALTPAALRALGEGIGLVETAAVAIPGRPLPLEAVLATSFPNPGDMETIRALYREDAAGGDDRLGLKASYRDGEIVVSYPMTMVVWRRQ